jgi:sialic acid synthase SpsE
MLQPTFDAGGVTLGAGHPALFLPDIGTFFNQDLARGMALIDRVAESGATFLKGEVLHDAGICLDSDLLENITTPEAVVTKEPYRRVIERKVVPLQAYERLFAHALRRGLRLALSVYDFAGLTFALDHGADLIKIASSNIVHRPLIERVAAARIPALLDTGGSTLDEVARAVGWFIQAGGDRLVIEHSPPAPPAAVSRHQLSKLIGYRDTFKCPVGLSDHHGGDEMLYAAIALGASVVEKGVYPDDTERDQDVAHGLPISRLADVIRKCANVAAAMQPPPADAPGPAGHPARMGLIAAAALDAGQVLRAGDLRFAFPALGVPVEQIGEAVGKRLRRAVERGRPIGWSDLE